MNDGGKDMGKEVYKLTKNDFYKVTPLVKSNHELSVYSTVNGILNGEVYVNSIAHPTAALIKTCECNYIAGDAKDLEFNKAVFENIDFWDQVTPDTSEWRDVICSNHKDKFIRAYTRRHYILENGLEKEINVELPEGYYLEEVNPNLLRQMKYNNVEDLIEWIDNWKDDEIFHKYGVGYYIRNDRDIVSWSLSDCTYNKKIAIGIHTDKKYRKCGFAKLVVSKVVQKCFAKGYESIDWLCVDCNKGSIGTAKSVGFKLADKYTSFTPYPPIENLKDLTEDEWKEWGDYLFHASKSEPKLLIDCMLSYIKGNTLEDAKDVLKTIHSMEIPMDFEMESFIDYLHSCDMASEFNVKWMEG